MKTLSQAKIDAATSKQVEAANPGDNVWVSANAGSGKTRVLIDRVARLLLTGVPPQNILCLTYTKAAASEMQNRLFARLGEWAMLSDGKLAQELQKLGTKGPFDANRLSQARRLFASAIEAPGGLRIQTIHAFCAGLLRRFPLEAGVSPQFKEIEDRAADLLRLEIVDDFARDQPSLIKPIAVRHSGEGLEKLLSEITRGAGFGTVPDPKMLAGELDLPPDPDDDLPLRVAWLGGEDDLVDEVIQAFEHQSATYKTFANKLASINHKTPNFAELETLFELFLYAKDKTSKSRNFPQSNHTKAVEAAAPIVDDLHAWMDRVAKAWDTTCALGTYHASLALHRFGHAVRSEYEARKARDALLDFDDLIGKALALLTDPAVAQWVLFKLDGGIDHILVDEAQDTSPDQWSVIRRLTEEFASGQGARDDVRRTLFVVGDKKQSIYSFQGADPEAFDRMRQHFDRRFSDAADRLEAVPLEYSFRSSPAILDVVDRTFVDENAEGVEADISHIGFKGALPGRVDLWPVVEATDDGKDDVHWSAPVDRPAPKDPKVVLAEQIAQRIRDMIDQKQVIPVEHPKTKVLEARPVTEADFLILVRRRSGVFPHLIRACKAAGLNIAGADRLKVGGELAVRDLGALLQFLALPEDDLSLACALRSPLFGWTEQDLFTLAHHRPKGQFLWEALRKSDNKEQTLIQLDDLLTQADFLRPFDLIDRILNRWDGRRKLLARLGDEAEDGIDALLSQALSYEQANVPSLTGFLGWMQSDDVEIKRQMDNQGDRLRVMTVHGAKGLEAPIVILPDCDTPVWTQRDQIIDPGGIPIWKPKSDQMPAVIRAKLDDMTEADRREWRRLLYVAMTRAETWLIVCAAGKVGDEGESWYRMVEAGLGQLAAPEIGDVVRHSHGDWDTLPPHRPSQETPLAELALPELGKVTAPIHSRTLSPSDLGGAKVLFGDAEDGLDGEAARERGTVLHRLLEHLPNHPPAERGRVADALLSGLSETFPVSDRDTLKSDALAVLEDPDLAYLFAKGALAEVDLSASVAALGGRLVHGAIDRLIVEPDRVLAVDYKSNRLVPNRPEDTPEGILRQMGAYAAMLESVFPDKHVEVAVLWIAVPKLMPISTKVVSEALSRVTIA